MGLASLSTQTPFKIRDGYHLEWSVEIETGEWFINVKTGIITKIFYPKTTSTRPIQSPSKWKRTQSRLQKFQLIKLMDLTHNLLMKHFFNKQTWSLKASIFFYTC